MGAHRIATHPFDGHVRVQEDGEILADSDRADRAGGDRPADPLLPPARGRADRPARTERDHVALPVQGQRQASFSAPSTKDAFWVYEAPSEEDALPIAKMLAPWPGRVEVRLDD